MTPPQGSTPGGRGHEAEPRRAAHTTHGAAAPEPAGATAVENRPAGRESHAREGGVREFRSKYADHKVGFFKLVRSEVIKIFSLASTYWLLGIAFVLTVGMAALFAFVPNESVKILQEKGLDKLPSANQAELIQSVKEIAYSVPMRGIFFSILIFAAFSVVVIAGEYGTGMIRSTMTAAPKRIGAIVAKLLVATILAGAVAFAAMLVSYLVGQALLDPRLHYGLGEGNVMRVILMNTVYVMLIVIMGFGLGLLLRNSAGGICTIIGILFALPIVALMAGQLDWVADAARFLPNRLGNIMGAVEDSSIGLDTPGGDGGPKDISWNIAAMWLCIESFVVFLAGLLVAKKRDV
ncbi:ABC transporter permease [Arthrobacter sp. UM1]|uniref:ABC transporter permease n=1 Tax=Arthrobacter sp. UM1 TaxID=2766776 RepID=UPI001CF633B7|nr:ABC transporter permease [Arthrobacter sp. UM1]MCB4208605.1 hypothetical protein [Arthrobacter sp. UM1]